jgi:hypothetical protein
LRALRVDRHVSAMMEKWLVRGVMTRASIGWCTVATGFRDPHLL